MEDENPENRKRRSSKDDSSEYKRKKPNSSHISASQSSQHPKKLIDQLFETWKNNDSTKSSGPSTPVAKSDIFKTFQSQQAALLLKKSSIDLKFSELTKEKVKFEAKQRTAIIDLKFCVDIYNNVQEDINSLYEDIRSMVELQKGIDQKLAELCDMRSLLIQNLNKKLNRKKDIFTKLSNDAKNSDIELKRIELEKLEEQLAELKNENEKLKISDSHLSDVKKKLNDVKELNLMLLTEEVDLNLFLQEETFRRLENNSKYAQELNKFEAEIVERQKDLESLNYVNETLDILHVRMKEMLSEKLDSHDFRPINLTTKIRTTQNKIKNKQFSLEAVNKLSDLTNCFLKLRCKLNETKTSIASFSLKTKEKGKIDETLIAVDKELKLLTREEISNEMKLLNNEEEELNLQYETLTKENFEILRKLNNFSNYNEEEEIIRNLKSEIDQKKKKHNELMESYKLIKEKNKEHFEEYPDLLDSNVTRTFEELKIKLKIDVDTAEKKKTSLTNVHHLKLKELEQKAKKYRSVYREVNQELKSGEKQFTDLEKQIEDAENELKNLRDERNEIQTTKKLEFKNEEINKLWKEGRLKTEAELKEKEKSEKEIELRKEKTDLIIKEETEKKKKPSIIKEEQVNLNEETMTLIKSLKSKLPTLQSQKIESENSEKKSSQTTVENKKFSSPFHNSDKKLTQQTVDRMKTSSPFHNSDKKLTQQTVDRMKTSSPFRKSNDDLDSKSTKSGERLFDQIFSQFGSQKSPKSINKFQKSADDIYAFKSDSHTSLEKLFSEFGSQKNQKIEVQKVIKDKEENANVVAKSSEVRSKQKERERLADRKFFRTSRRSKSLPPKKTR
ncbi:flagellar attachment zone protein 1-like [Leptopilina heterotoma]|uniref:flagellar attachment zone protein 1-like n=1 Tax=Leptopilina heterotoma TaxID=63436 RepID=UPI001CA7FE11|nr:flagellar attachment zone protein 1-like [Leptopilina heterotoma]